MLAHLELGAPDNTICSIILVCAVTRMTRGQKMDGILTCIVVTRTSALTTTTSTGNTVRPRTTYEVLMSLIRLWSCDVWQNLLPCIDHAYVTVKRVIPDSQYN